MLKAGEPFIFEVLQPSGVWVETHLEFLEGEDVIRIRKPDGEYAASETGQTKFLMKDTPLFQGDWID